MASPDPFAAAGLAPQAPATAQGADPFAAAGFAAAQAAQVPAQAAPASLTWGGIGPLPSGGMPVFSDLSLNKAAVTGAPRSAEKVGEGATFGMLPYLAAAGKWLGGEPWGQALQEARGYTAKTSKQEPGLSAVLEGAGSLIPAGAAVHAAAPAVRAVEAAVPYVGSPLAQAILGGGLGAASSAGHDIGSGETATLGPDVSRGATTGAVLGAASPLVGRALQAVPNVGSGLVGAVRSVVSGPGKDAVAGQILREASGDFANTAARSPIADLQLRTAQATGNPGLAALERTLASEPGAQAGAPGQIVSNGRTPDQMGALAKALVGPDAGIEPSILTNQASARGTTAIQNANTVLRQAESDLWNAPELRGVKVKADPFISGVQSDVAHMPPSFRMAIGQGPLAGLMGDVAGLEDGASLQDINAIRSRVLEQARASRAAGDNVTGSAAEALAGSLLNRTEGTLGGAGAPIQEAYAAARDFTRQRAQALGYPEFDAILRPNAAGNMRANDETTFGRFFDLNGGTDAGVQRLQGVSNLLRATGQPEAVAAANDLDNSAQQYARAAVLRQGRAGAGLDATGAPAMNPASLASTVNRMAPTLSGAPMTAPVAGDIQAAGNAAELLNRPSTLRGDTNSTTFEKLRNHDLVSAILGQSGSSALGAAAGGYLGAEYGPEDVPWYLRVPGGMLAGAMLGQRLGPYAGRLAAHTPFLKGAVNGPTEDIIRRVWQGLADPGEYQRLIGTMPAPPTAIMAPGAVSRAVPMLATGAVPLVTDARVGR